MKASQHPEAAFLATITASATHEVRNVLAIIKESAGLIEDMIHVFAKKGTLDTEKIFRAVDRIDTQVRRGADLLTNLNRLSHTLDSELATVELNEEVEQVVFLSQRFARKRGHRVVADRTDEEARTVAHPLHLHMALFAAMECCLEELPEGAAVTLSVGMRGGHPAVEFRGVSEDGTVVAGPSEGEAWAGIRKWTESLEAELERSETGFGIRILFPPETGAHGPASQHKG
jgi:C4-dicarboxylate-specific signal transduction histidine kinase